MPRQTADSSAPPRIARRRPPAFPRMGGEEPDLSADMKRRIMVERVARELFENLLFTGSDTPVALEVRRALNREFGEELFFQYLPGSPGMAVLHDTPRGGRSASGHAGGRAGKSLGDHAGQGGRDHVVMRIPRGGSGYGNQEHQSGDVPFPHGRRRRGVPFPRGRYGPCRFAPASVSHGDRVSVSRDAMLRTEAFSVAMSASDIRREKVDSIKEELASGRYKIDNRRIAGRLVQSEIGLFRR